MASRSGAGDELLDVVVIGGSQAGLAMAWHLARQHLRFVVLEAGPEPGHVWRSRWDSLTLFTPVQYDALPGMPFPGPPDTYPTKEQVADYLNAYAAEFDLPVRLNARVTALIRTAEGFEARTDDDVCSGGSLADRITSAPPPVRAGRSGGQGLGRRQRMAR
jgi:putative flavoprotein involved in K+ transport